MRRCSVGRTGPRSHSAIRCASRFACATCRASSLKYLPSGLVFNPAKPAELRLDFANADDDYNRDGMVTRADTLLVPTFGIWKQEFAGQPWVRLSSRVEVSSDLQEIEAQILSFTNHAIAH